MNYDLLQKIASLRFFVFTNFRATLRKLRKMTSLTIFRLTVDFSNSQFFVMLLITNWRF